MTGHADMACSFIYFVYTVGDDLEKEFLLVFLTACSLKCRCTSFGVSLGVTPNYEVIKWFKCSFCNVVYIIWKYKISYVG